MWLQSHGKTARVVTDLQQQEVPLGAHGREFGLGVYRLTSTD